MRLQAGQEVDAWCTRCKMDLTHRIVAMVADKPAKVECRTCYSTHVYRAPKNSPSAIAARSAPASSSPRASAARKPIPADHTAVVPPSGARIHPYRMTERFMKDQWIQHKTFGVGIVMSEIGADKIEVRFDGGVKTLVHGITP